MPEIISGMLCTGRTDPAMVDECDNKYLTDYTPEVLTIPRQL